MFLSCLLIDVGTNPDRPRPGRLWLRNAYHVHQRLCMAFPSKHRKAVDPDFVQSYVPHDFAAEQVHVKRGANVGFLYRIDPHSGGSVVILIQSALMPNWDFAFHNAETLLAARPEATPFNPAFNVSQVPSLPPDGKFHENARHEECVGWLASEWQTRSGWLRSAW